MTSNEVLHHQAQDLVDCHASPDRARLLDLVKTAMAIGYETAKKEKDAPLLRLHYLLAKYGTAFFAKLIYYTTASLDGKWVRLVKVDPIRLTAIVRGEDGEEKSCEVLDLDDFVL